MVERLFVCRASRGSQRQILLFVPSFDTHESRGISREGAIGHPGLPARLALSCQSRRLLRRHSAKRRSRHVDKTALFLSSVGRDPYTYQAHLDHASIKPPLYNVGMSFSNFGSHTGLQRNYSLYAAPAGWVLAMAPLWWAIAKTEFASPGAYNNAVRPLKVSSMKPSAH